MSASLASAGPIDPALMQDFVAASRILARHGVLDAWGHVSIRHPKNPERYLLSRALRCMGSVLLCDAPYPIGALCGASAELFDGERIVDAPAKRK